LQCRIRWTTGSDAMSLIYSTAQSAQAREAVSCIEEQPLGSGIQIDEGAQRGGVAAVLNRTSGQRRYAGYLQVTDTVAVSGAVILAEYVRFGRARISPGYVSQYVTSYSALFAILWLSALAGSHTRSPRERGLCARVPDGVDLKPVLVSDQPLPAKIVDEGSVSAPPDSGAGSDTVYVRENFGGKRL
jgi:hypothetical protein